MDILVAILILIVIGVVLYFIKCAPFIDVNFKWLITAVVVIATLLWLLSMFTGFHGFGHVHISR